MQAPEFDLQIVAERLTEKAYQLLSALPLVLLALLIIWGAWAFGGWLSRRAALNRIVTRNPFLQDLARTTTRWIVLLIGIILALDLLDATAVVGAVLGTAGVFGLALGFAFKNTLENYLAGMLMSLRQPFAPNDEVVIGGHHGSVLSLTSRATILMTLDGNHLRLPNALVFQSVMLNYTRNPSRRLEFDVGVGVQEDLVEAMRLGTEELGTLDGVMIDPPPRAIIQSLADSNVQIRYYAWVDQRTHDYLTVRSEAIRTVKMALEAADMDMPEPIYRVHMSSGAPAAAAREPVSKAVEMPRRAPSMSREAISPEVSRSDVVNTKKQTELDAQLDDGRKKSDSANLLDTSAPQE